MDDHSTRPWIQSALIMLGILFTPWHTALWAQSGTPADDGNGIRVQKPKQYPYRHLEKMISDLDAQLAQIRTIEATKIAQQVGTLQGSTRSTQQFSATATQSPIPGVTTNLEANEEGELVPKTATAAEAAVTPTPPTLEALSAGGLPSPNFGLAAADILSEQLQLQYEVYNLRLLQQRAISDRFYDNGSEQGSRLMALVGITVEVEPRREHRKAAAVVELTLRSKNGKPAPSLVALMPEERTYNSVAHSTKSNAFGGAALAGVFSLGFSGRWQSEKLYLYQDNDTLTFSRPQYGDNPSELTFGWEFRPVLGRESVDPGRRHLFAVLALDELESTGEQKFPFEVTARSHWLRYSTKHRVTRGLPRDERGASPPWQLEIRNAALLHKGWSPGVESVEVAAIDREKVLVKVKGTNLQPAPSVQIGDRTLASSELVHRSDGSFQFVAAAKEVLEKQVRVTGSEYGFSVPLEQQVDPNTGLAVDSFEFGPVRKGSRRDLSISLKHPHDPSKPPELHGRSVYAIFSGAVYELPADRWQKDAENPARLVGTVEVPTADVKADRQISVQIPFLGEKYAATSNAYQPTGISGVELLVDGDPLVWGLIGWGFDDDILPRVSVFAGKRYDIQNGLKRFDPHLLTLEDARSELAKQKKLLVFLPGYLEPIALKAPGVPEEKKPPEIAGSPPEAPENSSGSVTFKGTGLEAISKVTFDGDPLQFQSTKAGLRVFLNRAVTKHKGTVELLGHWDEKKFVVLELQIK